jgi:hypothetical protein
MTHKQPCNSYEEKWSLYLGAGNGSERCELLTETFIVNSVIQVLYIQVDSLVAVKTFNLELFTLTFKFLLALGFLLGTANIQRLESRKWVTTSI